VATELQVMIIKIIRKIVEKSKSWHEKTCNK